VPVIPTDPPARPPSGPPHSPRPNHNWPRWVCRCPPVPLQREPCPCPGPVGAEPSEMQPSASSVAVENQKIRRSESLAIRPTADPIAAGLVGCRHRNAGAIAVRPSAVVNGFFVGWRFTRACSRESINACHAPAGSGASREADHDNLHAAGATPPASTPEPKPNRGCRCRANSAKGWTQNRDVR